MIGNTQKAGGSALSGASPSSINRAQRQAVLQSSIEMIQQIYSGTLASGQVTLNVPPRNVGLTKKFLVNISGTANNTDGVNAANLSDFGLSNLLSSVVFTDLNNNVRVQTAGWHLALLQALKNQWPMTTAILQSALQEYSGDMGGAAWNVITAPTGFAHGTSQPFNMWFEVPLAYSDDDLRGSIYMNVVNAVAQLQLNITTTPFAASGVDSTLAVWKGAAGNISGITVTVYQVYLDQLPVAKGQPILPALDLSTVYEVKNTTFGPFTAGQDNPMPYANFRDFLSTFLVYNSNPAADAGRTAGTDTNYLALQSANFTNIWKVSPQLQALKTRAMLGHDLALGVYYISSRRKPISTTTFGNMNLISNPSAAAASNYALVGYEDFALVNTLLNASGLAGS